MDQSLTVKSPKSEKLIWFFLLGWALLNMMQAYTLELHPDEAYYWIYSRLLDWGYYDHPPMVALFIRAGYYLFHNELGLRLLTVLSSTLSLRLLWLIVRKYNTDAFRFILIVGGMFVFHIYGFTTTPDAPLFLFTIIFYYLFQQYLVADKWQLALAISLTLACLLYSKYHGVLIVAFTLLANIKLLKRPSFWIIPVITTLLFLPHIFWQISHDYPSLRYHLYERSAEVYNFTDTLGYLPGQIFMAGPLIGWLLFYYAAKIKVKDAFIRTLLVNGLATILFFWINTFKGSVQPHWTLIAFVPLTILVMVYFKQGYQPPKWFNKLAIINIAVILLLRFALVAQLPVLSSYGHLRSYFGNKQWVSQIKHKAGDAYVIFPGNFQDPARYCFYTHSLKGFAYDTRYYRRTQYDIWPIEDSLQHQRTYYITDKPQSNSPKEIKLNTVRGMLYLNAIDDTRTYQRIDIKSDRYDVKTGPGKEVTFRLLITNPYPYPINFTNLGQLHPVFLAACFIKNDAFVYGQRADSTFNAIKIQPGQTANYTFKVHAPVLKGHTDLIFSLRTTPFDGGRNSRIINFTVQ